MILYNLLLIFCYFLFHSCISWELTLQGDSIVYGADLNIFLWSQVSFNDSRTHPRRSFPRRTFPRQTLSWQTFPRPDTFPKETSPIRHITDGHFPNQINPRRTLPRPDTSPTNTFSTRHIPDGHFPDQTNAQQIFTWVDFAKFLKKSLKDITFSNNATLQELLF